MRAHHKGQPAVTDDNVVAVSSEYFAWNFADAIPLLKAPETLDWKLERTYGGWWSGSLLMLYKLLVLIPIAAVLARSLRPREDKTPAATSRRIPG